MANEIKSDEKLLKSLEEAAKRQLSDAEREQQRISFIYAGMPKDSSMSKIDIARILKKAS